MLFEVILYLYYWQFMSTWNQDGASHWKWFRYSWFWSSWRFCRCKL